MTKCLKRVLRQVHRYGCEILCLTAALVGVLFAVNFYGFISRSKTVCATRHYCLIYTNQNFSIRLPRSSKAQLVNDIKPLLIQSFVYF